MKKTFRAITAEEFAHLPDNGMRQELVRGEVREMPPVQYRHGRTTHRIQVVLEHFVSKAMSGEVIGEMGFVIERDPDTLRAPDCAYVRAGRIPPGFGNGYLPFAPDLAVEVLSPEDRPGDVREKVDGWLLAGARLVWVIDPDRRSATVHRHDAPPRELAEGDVLDGGDVLPGFSVPLSELLA
jgi:Uma2 family endonuclease